MTDKSILDDEEKKEVEDTSNSVDEKSLTDIASFEDLEGEDGDNDNDNDKHKYVPEDDASVYEEPLSLAEEEEKFFKESKDDVSEDLSLESFTKDEILDEGDNELTELNEIDELELDDNLPIIDDDISTAAQPTDIEIVMNPHFDNKLLESKDPFPLPEDLAQAVDEFKEPDTANIEEQLDDLELDMPGIEDDTDTTAPELEMADDEDLDTFSGLELELADDDDFDEPLIDLDELPNLDAGSFEESFEGSDLEEKFFRETITLTIDDLYNNVLKTLYESDDIGIDATAKARVGQSLKLKKLPQMVCRDLVIQKIVSPVQLARAIARTQKRKEITSFLNIPHESMGLRKVLDSRVCGLLREARVIPLWHKLVTEEDGNLKGNSELHLAHEAPTKNLVLEAAVSELLPDHKFVWHFALRDVCGAFWLSGEDEDVDSSMEADALLDRIIGNAIDARSSDIHIDPSIKGDFKAMVRYRIDGFVQSKEVITLDQLQRLRIRIENIARMPKVDLNHPNKGAFTRSGYDWRIQIQPHAGRQGPLPRIVIRRLNPDVMAMEELGYPEYFIQYVREASKSPNGVILWTGPTGSGKTESIHSAIVSANPMGRGLSVHTIEDPPEKRVAGYAVQMEMTDRDPARSGLELLKSSLRADPDVIVFGEVRDPEMAGLVFEAANTGHLVFSTLHTNTALDAIVRLDELGIFGFNVSYIRGIAAQKLVRRLCTHCKQPLNEPDEYTRYVFDKFEVDSTDAKLFTHDPSGCPSCSYTGYHGRIAIAEWLSPNKEVVDLSVARDYLNLEEVARRAGWKPMGYMGVLHVKNGITDVHELSAKVQELAGDI